MIIWTNHIPPDVLWLFACVDAQLIHVDDSDRKTSMPSNLNTEVRDTKTEPIAGQLSFPLHSYEQIKAKAKNGRQEVALCSEGTWKIHTYRRSEKTRPVGSVSLPAILWVQGRHADY